MLTVVGIYFLFFVLLQIFNKTSKTALVLIFNNFTYHLIPAKILIESFRESLSGYYCNIIRWPL